MDLCDAELREGVGRDDKRLEDTREVRLLELVGEEGLAAGRGARGGQRSHRKLSEAHRKPSEAFGSHRRPSEAIGSLPAHLQQWRGHSACEQHGELLGNCREAGCLLQLDRERGHLGMQRGDCLGPQPLRRLQARLGARRERLALRGREEAREKVSEEVREKVREKAREGGRCCGRESERESDRESERESV